MSRETDVPSVIALIDDFERYKKIEYMNRLVENLKDIGKQGSSAPPASSSTPPPADPTLVKALQGIGHI